MSRSPIFEFASRMWSAMRRDYELLLEHQFVEAENACRGHLLNKRGRAEHVDPRTLFTGPEARAYTYASDELAEWWLTHPRLTVTEFERQWWRDDHAESAVAS